MSASHERRTMVEFARMWDRLALVQDGTNDEVTMEVGVSRERNDVLTMEVGIWGKERRGKERGQERAAKGITYSLAQALRHPVHLCPSRQAALPSVARLALCRGL